MGACCTDNVCQGKIDICSKEVESLDEMKYHACPKEELCGDYFITPDSDGAITELMPADNLFKEGNLCTYQIGYPGGVTDKDRLSVQLDALY
mmetsp:Transcript_35922/g.55169  ORF Transcript_35922/g.55169 Transcript_35922/m.55169 type:complete len:92 (+) Transcript_35922:202-477(+)